MHCSALPVLEKKWERHCVPTPGCVKSPLPGVLSLEKRSPVLPELRKSLWNSVRIPLLSYSLTLTLAKVAEATAVGGFVNAGQVCISTQRVLAHRKIYAEFLEALKGAVNRIKVGDPMAEDTRLERHDFREGSKPRRRLDS